MISFLTPKLGRVTIRFRHYLPSVEVPACRNDLVGMIKNLKIQHGYTACELTWKDTGFDVVNSVFGMAYTHPGDQYNKEVGREISLERAIKAACFSEQERRLILAGYYSR